MSITDFFDSYVCAFLQRNVDAIASLYDFPMSFYTESAEVMSFTQDDFNSSFTKLLALYDELGVKRFTFHVQDTTELSASFTLVTLTWSFQDDAGREIYNATTRYILQTTDNQFVIKSVIVVDETSKIQNLLTS